MSTLLAPEDRTGQEALAAEWLVRELDTDWIPDPWGWSGFQATAETASPDAGSDYSEPLLVPFLGGRRRSVPILGPFLRFVFTLATIRVAADADQDLAPGVLAYRIDSQGVFEHYRDARRRKAKYESALADTYQAVLQTDLERFFPSITLSALRNQLERRFHFHELLDALNVISEHVGYPIPEGYAASRVLANISLAQVDETIGQPFTRWIDDYRIFLTSEDDASEALAKLREQLSLVGLCLSERKTRISALAESSQDDLLPSQAKVDLWSYVAGVIDSLNENPPDRQAEAACRLALRYSAEAGRSELIASFAAIDSALIPASWIPRLAWVLSSATWTSASTRVIRELVLVEDEFTQWRRARLLPALWYAPQSAALTVTDAFLNTTSGSLLELLAVLRVLAKHNPGRLMNMRSISDTSGWRRAFILAVQEARSPEAFSAGPPLEAYL